MSLVGQAFDLYFASVHAIVYEIYHYIGPRYNGTRLYMVKMSYGTMNYKPNIFQDITEDHTYRICEILKYRPQSNVAEIWNKTFSKTW